MNQTDNLKMGKLSTNRTTNNSTTTHTRITPPALSSEELSPSHTRKPPQFLLLQRLFAISLRRTRLSTTRPEHSLLPPHYPTEPFFSRPTHSVAAMCMGMGQQMLIPPTEKARLIADYLRACFGLLLVLSLLEFLSLVIIGGFLDLVAVFVGYMAIRNPEGYNYQQVVCFLILQAAFFFYAVIRLFTNVAGIKTIGSTAPTAQWAYYIYATGMLAGPIVYTLSIYFTYQLYKQMKIVLDEMMNGMAGGGADGGGGGPLMGNGYDVQAPSDRERRDRDRQAGAGMWRHEERHPDPPPVAPSAPAVPPAGGGSFTAFSGQGHKLGD